MLAGTERDVLELLLEAPRSPTEVAEELGVSVQTASRNLKSLVDGGFAERTQTGEGRGYKRFRAREFARVFAGFEGELFDRTLPLDDTGRAVLSVLKVPQQEFHPVLLSYLFASDSDTLHRGVQAVIVYGSVARGEAQVDSDVDVLVVWNGDGEEPATTSFAVGDCVVNNDRRVVSETWFTVEEFHDGLDSGSQFLGNVLDEGIVLYDPEEVVEDARAERAGRRVSQ